MTENFIYPLCSGVFLGLGLILPLGPQNVYILTQGVQQPRLQYALPCVFAAGAADTLLILTAVFGLATIVAQVPMLKLILSGVGIVFLTFFGWKMWRSPLQNPNTTTFSTDSVTKQLYFTATVSLLNPHAILDSCGVIGSASLLYDGPAKAAFTMGSILASWVWFMSLLIIGQRLRSLDSSGSFQILLNKFSATIMWTTAIYLAYQIW